MRKTTLLYILYVCTLIMLCMVGCSDQPLPTTPNPSMKNATGEKYQVKRSSLSDAQLRRRCDLIKQRAARKGITNALIIAGIAYHETGLAQCVNEYTMGASCSAGYSTSCPSGVLAGAGDGPCRQYNGGIGMFQLDAGKQWQTINTYGIQIMEDVGNIDAGIDFVIKKLGFQCTCTPCFSGYSTGTASSTCRYSSCSGSYNNLTDRATAIRWFNSLRPNTSNFETYVRALAHCYNGCRYGYRGCGSASARKTHDDIKSLYRRAILNLYNKFGHAYWFPSTNTSSSSSNSGTSNSSSSNTSRPRSSTSGSPSSNTVASGSGRAGRSGNICLRTYTFSVRRGQRYEISTCDNFSGDPYLRVIGDCQCSNDDACRTGSKCTCTATKDGTARICASTYASSSATWNYKITRLGGGPSPSTSNNSNNSSNNRCIGSGPFAGYGTGGNNGRTCIARYNFNVVAGHTYTISTTHHYGGDTYLRVSGACTCSNDDYRRGTWASQCSCRANRSGVATICASSLGSRRATWSYRVTCR